MTTITAERAAFLEERRTRLGGTDVAAIFGRSKWKTAADVRADKLGLVEPWAGNVDTEAGELLEDDVLELYRRRTGREIEVPTVSTVPHPRIACLGVQVDALIPGERGIDAKAPRHRSQEWGEPGSDQVPADYVFQAQAGMACLGVEEWDVPVLFRASWDFEVYTVRRNDRLIRAIEEVCPAWWERHVVRGEPCPDVVETARIEIDDDASLTADSALLDLCHDLYRLKAQADEIEERTKTIRAEIEERMGAARFLIDAKGAKLIDRQPVKGGRVLHVKSIREHKPELYAELLADLGVDTAPSRRFCPRYPSKKKS